MNLKVDQNHWRWHVSLCISGL